MQRLSSSGRAITTTDHGTNPRLLIISMDSMLLKPAVLLVPQSLGLQIQTSTRNTNREPHRHEVIEG